MNDDGRVTPGNNMRPENQQVSDALPNVDKLARQIAGIAERSQQLVGEFLKRQSGEEGIGMASPLAIGAAFFEMTARMMSDPSRLVQAQLSLWNDYMTLWQRTAQRFLGGQAEPMITPAQGDRCSTLSSRAIC
jgi:polyhydroxyalkanoate synthase subunit PhaC